VEGSWVRGERAPRALPVPARRRLMLAATFTVEPIVDALELLMIETALGHEVAVAPYGQLFQQLLDPGQELSRNRQGVNAVLVRLQDWSRGADGGDGPIDREALRRNVDAFVAALREAAGRGGARFIVCLCAASPAAQADAQDGPFLAEMAERVVAGVSGVPAVRVVRAESVPELPPSAVHDPEGDRLGHVPYTPLYFAALASRIARLAHALESPPLKVLALDCDNTLWQGVVGEDGVDGIAITERHAALQRFALERKQAGMILCLVSKNAEADVQEVLRSRADMLLRPEDFVATRVNWLPKSENLRSLAAELNLGLDSFVFVDDSPLECAEVEASCPEVLSLGLPADGDFRSFLGAVWPLDLLDVTAEDAQRTELYRQNLERDRHQRSSASLADFLASLELRIQIERPREDQLARAAQLTQRTNQFNFTTRRRTEAELAALLAAGRECRVVEVRDRFGDCGLVGLMIYGVDGGDLVVDTFLLSCRVLARGVEHAMVRALGEAARERGLQRVRLPFFPTPKNLPAARFLKSLPAAVALPADGGTDHLLLAEDAAALVHAPEGAAAAELPAGEAPRPAPVADLGRSARWNRLARELDTPEKILARLAAGRRARSLAGEPVPPRTETERRLAAIWAESLNLSAVGIRDDYFALGGTSLLAVTVCARIERELGVRFPLAALLEAPTIEALAAWMQRDTASQSLLVLQEGDRQAPPLFLVHDADGETLLYRNLAKRLGEARMIYALQPLRGKGTPIVHTRIADMAAHYVAEIRKVRPRGPYLLGGLCAGATIAFEMARQIEAAGEEARLVALFDAADVETPLRPHLETQRRLARLREALREGALRAAPRTLASKARGYLGYQLDSRLRAAADRLAVLTLRACLDRGWSWPPWARRLDVRAVYKVAEAEYRPRHVTNRDIVLFRAQSGVGLDAPFVRVYADPALGWGCRTSKDVRIFDVPGGHASMLQEPHVAELARVLGDDLAAAGA
jgi:FkbH-like protein